MSNPFRYFNSSPEVIRLVVMMYVRYPLSLRNVEDLLAERGIDISHETVRFWWNRFGPIFAAEIRKRRVARIRAYPQWRRHLDEVFVKVNGKLCYLWRAVDHEGEVLEAVVTARRDKAAALKLLKRIMKKYGAPCSIVTDRLRAYSAAMNEIGVAAERHEVARRLNNRAENSHQPFRRRERAMQQFRSMKTLQKFSSLPGAQPIQSGAASRHSAGLQGETLDRIDGVAHPRSIDRRLRAGVSRCASTNAVTLTTPLLTYVRSNKSAIINYRARYRSGRRIATALVESGVNSLVARRMVKKQQMQWSKRGAHLLLQVRAAVLNGDLRERLTYRPPNQAHRSRIAWMGSDWFSVHAQSCLCPAKCR
jgi:putative transposase